MRCCWAERSSRPIRRAVAAGSGFPVLGGDRHRPARSRRWRWRGRGKADRVAAAVRFPFQFFQASQVLG